MDVDNEMLIYKIINNPSKLDVINLQAMKVSGI